MMRARHGLERAQGADTASRHETQVDRRRPPDALAGGGGGGPSPTPERQDWPLRCICNLCQCGGHRCSTFSWDDRLELAGQRALRQARDADELADGDDENLQLQGEPRCQCRHGQVCEHELAERYLTRPSKLDGNVATSSVSFANHANGADALNGGKPSASADLELDESMLHVLVTRPEIAGRPRDNIVFEGDMDLKTTFETSYEALARMRLDHWRRHQEARGGGGSVTGVGGGGLRKRQTTDGGGGNGRQSAAGDDVSVSRQRQQQRQQQRSRKRAMNRTQAAASPANQAHGAATDGRATATRRHTRQAARRTSGAELERHAGGVDTRFESTTRAMLDGDDDDDEDDEQLMYANGGAVDDGDEFAADNDHDGQYFGSSATPKARGPTKARQLREGGKLIGTNQGRKAVSADQQASPGMALGGDKVARTPPPSQTPSPAKQLPVSSPISRRRSPAPQDDHEHDGRRTGTPSREAHRRSQTQTPQPPPTPPPPQVQRQAAAGVASRQFDEQINNFQQQQQQQQHSTQPPTAVTSDYVDPDLSSIICYDANMNRLERVGLRKRSKYRPSTSLRPGARGFFGDGANAGELDGHGDESESKNMSKLTTAPEKSRPSELGIAGATTKELDRADDSNVSGRRHLLGHANRKDHIKEQNIVEHKRRFEDKSTLTERLERQSIEDADEGQNEAAQQQQQADLERRLAEEEESAAVAEIQRCTREAIESQQVAPATPDLRAMSESDFRLKSSTPGLGGGDGGQLADASANNAASRASSRQSRQQRVCQNQSFNINENQYPQTKADLGDDYCIKIGGRDTAALASNGSSRASQRDQNSTSPYGLAALRGEKAKNLFRESPDFILTTGHADQRSRTTGHKQKQSVVVANQVAGGGGGGGRISQMSAISENNAEELAARQLDRKSGLAAAAAATTAHSPCPCNCRVLNLDNRYEFVGSRSGHKYFIERDLNTKETMLAVGETA